MITKQGKSYYRVEPLQSILELLDYAVNQYGDKPAVIHREHADDEPVVRSYRELTTDVNCLKQGLAKAGARGGRIAVIGENSYAWITAYLAAITSDSWVVPLDRLLKMDEVKALLERADVDTLFYDASYQAELEKVLPELPSLKRIIPMLTRRATKATQARVAAALASGTIGAVSILAYDAVLTAGRDALAAGTAVSFPKIDVDAPHALLFTSGTTATSKGVLLSHKNLASDVLALAGVVRFEAGFRSLSVLPLHHTFENTCGLLTVLYFGGTICIADGLRHIQKNLQEYKVDMMIGVPALFDQFYKKIQAALEKKKKVRLVSMMRVVTRALRKIGIDLRRKVFAEILESLGGELSTGISGAAAIDPKVIRFFDDIGVRILQGYGLTETSPVAAGCNDFVFVVGSTGHPLAGIEIAIDSDDANTPGEILIRGPIVMKGYYKDEAATREAIDADGWFHSGDLGVFTKKGVIKITGRLKSMIVLESGKKVFPEEIEALINQHDYVKDSLVYAQADEKGDLVVSAKVVLDEEAIKKDQTLTITERLEQIMKDVNQSIPTFKNVKSYFYSFKDMVRTTTLKVKRNVEIAHLSELTKKHKLNWRKLIGQNIDKYQDDDAKTH